jgi:sulfate adenylyltransferase subunit 2
VRANVNPFDQGTQRYTHVMKTEALKQALDHYGFDAAFGGARATRRRAARKSASSRSAIASTSGIRRTSAPSCGISTTDASRRRIDPRVPLSNWTELDVWLYAHAEKLPARAAVLREGAAVVRRNGAWIMVDDERLPLEKGEKPALKKIRFRTLGCYPLTGGVESDADTVPR